MTRIEGMHWHGVLAGAYMTDAAMERMVAHLCDEELRPLCRRVKAERICDLEAGPDEKRCPKCLEREAKLTTKK